MNVELIKKYKPQFDWLLLYEYNKVSVKAPSPVADKNIWYSRWGLKCFGVTPNGRNQFNVDEVIAIVIEDDHLDARKAEVDGDNILVKYSGRSQDDKWVPLSDLGAYSVSRAVMAWPLIKFKVVKKEGEN